MSASRPSRTFWRGLVRGVTNGCVISVVVAVAACFAGFIEFPVALSLSASASVVSIFSMLAEESLG